MTSSRATGIPSPGGTATNRPDSLLSSDCVEEELPAAGLLSATRKMVRPSDWRTVSIRVLISKSSHGIWYDGSGRP